MKLIILKTDNKLDHCVLINEKLVSMVYESDSNFLVIETVSTVTNLGELLSDEKLNFMLELQNFLKVTHYGSVGFLINRDRNNLIYEYKLITDVKNESDSNT